MAISPALRRLLGIREAEEQHRRTLLEMATAELHRLESALKNTEERSRLARTRIWSSVQSGVTEDRIAGLEEIAVSDRVRTALLRRIDATETDVATLGAEYLEKRLERRQAETLVDTAIEKEELESNRRAQRELDDWHLSRRSSASGTTIRITKTPPEENKSPILTVF